ncbi:MAG TPA: chemotaxis protein, partial [Cupriavidus sp.]|nr:chemotaxis protein [Cupriavidus sp.]
GVPEMEKDADGSMILNDAELDLALRQAESQAGNIEAARS